MLQNTQGALVYKMSNKKNPNKMAIIKRVPTPQKQRDVRSFLGQFRYYRRFITDFNKVASPLFALLAKDSRFF